MTSPPRATIPPLIAALMLFAAAQGAAIGDDETRRSAESGAEGFEREGARAYVFDPGASNIRVLVYRGGFFANAGHNHVLAIEDFTGSMWIHDELRQSGFELVFRLDDLILDRPTDRAAAGGDFSSKLSEDDIAGTRRNMLGDKVTEAERYPEVSIRSQAVTGALPDLLVTVQISLHGVTRDLEVPVNIEIETEQLIASGEFQLRQKDFGIKPFSAALGTLKIKNELEVRFRLVATREPDQPGQSE